MVGDHRVFARRDLARHEMEHLLGPDKVHRPAQHLHPLFGPTALAEVSTHLRLEGVTRGQKHQTRPPATQRSVLGY